MESGIYRIINTINDKKYIGSAFKFKVRFDRHKRDLKNNRHPNRHLQNSYNKYGEDDVEITPAVLYDGTEVKTAAVLKFSKWMEYPITESMIGAKLGFDIIIGAINYTLNTLPVNLPDGYIIGT